MAVKQCDRVRDANPLWSVSAPSFFMDGGAGVYTGLEFRVRFRDRERETKHGQIRECAGLIFYVGTPEPGAKRHV